MSIDVEYAIKKDVRNNPIVREVDWQQKREFLRAVGLGALIVGMLLVWAWPQVESVNHGYELSRLRRELAAEEKLNRQLRLELETLRAPQRLEARATKELDMSAPGSARTMMLQRAIPTTASRAIVATAR
jgi:cell division protein FtsL